MAAIPRHWTKGAASRGGGVVFRDPERRDRGIRLMPGYPPGSRADQRTWGPYAVVSQNGRRAKIPLKGNPTLDEE